MESNNTIKNPAANTATPKTEKFDFKKTLKETFETIKNVFVKPASADISRFDNAKNAAIFTGFAAVIYIVTYHLSSLISTIVKKGCDYSYKSYRLTCDPKTTIDFSRLDGEVYFVTLKAAFIGLLATLAIASVVTYIMGLIFKKQPKFMKLVAIIMAGLAPTYLLVLISTILYFIWEPLGIIVTIVSLVLTFAFIINAITKELALEGDKKIFFHVATITALVIAISLLVYFAIGDSITKLLDLSSTLEKLGS